MPDYLITDCRPSTPICRLKITSRLESAYQTMVQCDDDAYAKEAGAGGGTREPYRQRYVCGICTNKSRNQKQSINSSIVQLSIYVEASCHVVPCRAGTLP